MPARMPVPSKSLAETNAAAALPTVAGTVSPRGA